jgi:hypothetical protein
MTHEASLRKHLIELLDGGSAHIRFADVVKDFPVDHAGIRPPGAPHSAWELLEHIRIAQHDILCFSEDPEKYVELKWPEDYWPSSPAPASADEWNSSVAAIQKDAAALLKLVNDPARDLFEPFPWGSGQTLLREALLVADHNAYHLGQLLLVRQMIEKASAGKQ